MDPCAHRMAEPYAEQSFVTLTTWAEVLKTLEPQIVITALNFTECKCATRNCVQAKYGSLKLFKNMSMSKI